MRLIFFTLVGVNVLLAVWGVFIRDTEPQRDNTPSPILESKVKTITAIADKNEEAGGETPNQSNAEAQPRMCELVGSFPSEEDAENFIERLRSIDIESEIERIELETGASHWVHLPVEETSAIAFRKLAELQALKVESYVIGKGDLKNAVSLGVFTKEPLAINKRDEVKAMGFEPQITTKPRTEIELWVNVQPEYAQKISDITWRNLLDGMSSQERRQNFCLPVASGDNFQ